MEKVIKSYNRRQWLPLIWSFLAFIISMAFVGGITNWVVERISGVTKIERLQEKLQNYIPANV